MTKALFPTPALADLIGSPPGRFLIHEFPMNMPAGETVQVTLNGLDEKLTSFSENNIKPDKKHRQPKKMVRNREITLLFPQKIKAMKLFLDVNSQIVFVLGRRDSPIVVGPEILKPIEARITTYYEKENRNKRKVLNACFFGPGHPVTHMSRALASCEVVIAVDTNSQDIPGIGKVTATTAIEACFNMVTEDACHMQSGPVRQKITLDPPCNPEIFGIGTTLRHFFDTNPELRDKSIGVITDTELGLLKSMNQRTTPFFDSMLLPENITLFYATSDSGSSEFDANKLIRMCDTESTKLLKKYLTETLAHKK